MRRARGTIGGFLLAALLALASLTLAAGTADHYKVLGVSKSAGQKEIRAAYRKLALELHPDKNSAADAAQKFAAVAEAWEILGDVDKRRIYDRGGQQQAHFGAGFHAGWGGFQHHQQRQQHSTEDLYLDAPLITRLTGATFASKVSRSTTHWAVNFYATWCGHCVLLAPHWKKAALRLSDDDNVELGAVNCAVEQQLCNRHGVQSFPTVKFFALSPDPNGGGGAANNTATAEEGGSGSGGASSNSEPRSTVFWTTYPMRQQADAEHIADWARDTAAHAARARVTEVLVRKPGTTAAPKDFAETVEKSPLLWVVLFTARESGHWCPACPHLETAFFRLSAEFPPEAKIGFALVDCEKDGGRELCVKYSIGHPYTHQQGNFPQVLGFPAGSPRRKRNPERLLPQLFQFVSQATERLESLQAPLRLAIGMRQPGAAAGAQWRSAKDAAGRRYYWQEGAAESVWSAPKGWDPHGPDEQVIPEPEEEEGEEGGAGAGGAGCNCNCTAAARAAQQQHGSSAGKPGQHSEL